MKRDSRRLPDYLGHILEAIDRIDRYTAGMEEADFLRSGLVQDAVIRNLEVIGEASKNTERTHPGFAASHPELPLLIAYDMRNSLSHGYFAVDLAIVWRTVARELPGLRRLVASLLESLGPQG